MGDAVERQGNAVEELEHINDARLAAVHAQMVSNGRPVRPDGAQLVGVSLCEHVEHCHSFTHPVAKKESCGLANPLLLFGIPTGRRTLAG